MRSFVCALLFAEIFATKEIQPNNEAKVSIEIPDGMDGDYCKVYRQEISGEMTDMNAKRCGNNLVFSTDHFSIYIVAQVSEKDLIYGDVNGDGIVDVKDIVLFAQYLASWNVEIDEATADCNADGAINILDVVLLAQHLAWWEVTLG